MPTSKPLRPGCRPRGADQLVVDPTGGWNEPTRRAARDPARRSRPRWPRASRERVERGSSEWASRWTEAESEGPSRARGGDRGSRRADRARPAARRSAPLYADGDLVYTNSSMPIRDQEVFLPLGDADVLFLTNRGANGIDGLISSAVGAAHATGRPTVVVTGELGLLHDLGGLAALRDAGAPVRIVVDRQRRRRDLPLPPPARGDGGRGVRGAAGDSARHRRRQGGGAVRHPPPAGRAELGDLGEAPRRRDRPDRGPATDRRRRASPCAAVAVAADAVRRRGLLS